MSKAETATAETAPAEADAPEAEAAPAEADAPETEAAPAEADAPETEAGDQPAPETETSIDAQVKENTDKLDELLKMIQTATNAAASKQGGLQKQIEANSPIITAVVNVMEVAGKTMVKKYFDVVFGLLGSFFSSYNSTKGEGKYTKAKTLELTLQDPNVKKSVQLVGKTLGEIFGSFLETSGEQILIQGPKLTEAAYTLPNKVARNILFALADAAVAVASTLPIIGTIISGGKIFQRIVMSGTTIFINFLGALVGVSEMFVSFSGSDKTKSGMGDLITNVKSALEAIKTKETEVANNIEALGPMIEGAVSEEGGGKGKEEGKEEGEEGGKEEGEEGGKQEKENKQKEAKLVEAVSQSEKLEEKIKAALEKLSTFISSEKNNPKKQEEAEAQLKELQKSAEGIPYMGGKINETSEQILKTSKNMLKALKTTANDNVLIKELVTAQNKLKESAKNIAKDVANSGSKFIGRKEPGGIERQYEELSDQITELKINKGILSKTKRGILGGPYVFEEEDIPKMIPGIVKQGEKFNNEIRKKKIKDLEREIKIKKTQKKQMTPKYKKARKSRKKRQKKIRAFTSPFRLGMKVTKKIVRGGQKNKTIKKRNIKKHSKHSNQSKKQSRRKLVIEK